jgi:hypothetical protein
MDYPVKVKGACNWKEKHIEEAYLTNVDIERMLKHGSTMEIHEGYFWEETFSPFKKMLTVFTNEKMKQDKLDFEKSPEYNNELREICKLMGNSLFGRQLMTIEPSIYHQVKCITDVELDNNDNSILWTQSGLMVKQKGEEENGCIQFGVFILAYSRDLMQKYFDIVGRENVIATETDSVFLPTFALDKVKEHIGKKLGMLDYEFNNCEEAIFAGKKFYFIENADGKKGKKDKMRCKGQQANHLSKEVYTNVLFQGKHLTKGILQFQRMLFGQDFTGILISENVEKTLKRDTKLTYYTYTHDTQTKQTQKTLIHEGN